MALSLTHLFLGDVRLWIFSQPLTLPARYMSRSSRFSLAHPITLAPMEEHTNFPFRLLMKQHGASLVCTEPIDAVDVARRERRALRLLHTTTQEKPRAGQVSGADPAAMAEAARVVEELGFDLVDLNFECPIRRLIGRGEGGALLADPPIIETIVAAVVKAVSIPVTLKIRSGPDAARETAPEIARRAEGAGAAAVDVHARSVAQAYVGGPDWSVVARVKQRGVESRAGRRRHPQGSRYPAVPARDRSGRRGHRPGPPRAIPGSSGRAWPWCRTPRCQAAYPR